MGAALEAGKLVAAAWLTEHWHSAPPLLRLPLVAMIGMLMSLNAVGVFGILTGAHLDHMRPSIWHLPRRPLGSLPWQSIPPIAKWPPERLAHLVIDDAGIQADITQHPLVEVRELAARHAAAMPLAQRRDERD